MPIAEDAPGHYDFSQEYCPASDLSELKAQKETEQGGIVRFLDFGSKLIAAVESYNLAALQPSADAGGTLWDEIVTWGGEDVRKYTALVAHLFSLVNEKNVALSQDEWELLMPIGGMTSSGLLSFFEARSEDLHRIHGVQLPVIFSPQELAHFKPELELIEGRPTKITVPGAASIDAINEYLRELHPGYEVYYDITTSNCSTIAANYFTGGLGDNRLALDVDSLVAVFADGSVRKVTKKNEVELLRGTQGYVCMGTEFTLNVRKVPKTDEQLIVQLDGDTHEKTYQDSLVCLINSVYPYLVKRDPNGIWVDGIEVLDGTGMKTILRMHKDDYDADGNELPKSGSAKLADELLKQLGDVSVAAIMLRVRHNYDGSISQIEGDQEAQDFVATLEGINGDALYPLLNRAEELLQKYYGEGLPGDLSHKTSEVLDCREFFMEESDLNYQEKAELTSLYAAYDSQSVNGQKGEPIRRIDYISDPVQVGNRRALRADVPDRRRAEAEKLASGSTDREFIFDIEEGASIDDIREGISAAMRDVMGVILAVAEKAKKTCHITWNGHVNPVPSALFGNSIFDGAGNLHLAVTAKTEDVSKDEVNGYLYELSEELTALHGNKYGPVTLRIECGEKNYPPTTEKRVHEYLHWVSNHSDFAAKQLALMICGGPSILNFRMVDYESVLKKNGFEYIWDLALAYVEEMRIFALPSKKYISVSSGMVAAR